MVGLPDSDGFLHGLALWNQDVVAVDQRHAVHLNLQSLLISVIRQYHLEDGVVVTVGVALVRHVQRKGSFLSGGHIGQRGLLGAVHAISADAYVGLLHLFRAVAQHVLSGLEPLRVFLTFIGVVGLAAEK